MSISFQKNESLWMGIYNKYDSTVFANLLLLKHTCDSDRIELLLYRNERANLREQE